MTYEKLKTQKNSMETQEQINQRAIRFMLNFETKTLRY